MNKLVTADVNSHGRGGVKINVEKSMMEAILLFFQLSFIKQPKKNHVSMKTPNVFFRNLGEGEAKIS